MAERKSKVIKKTDVKKSANKKNATKKKPQTADAVKATPKKRKKPTPKGLLLYNRIQSVFAEYNR